MTKRILPAMLAIAVLASLPLAPAYARGGGGGGGGGNDSGHGGSSHSNGYGYGGNPQDATDEKLFDDARRECNGPKYPSGATPRINYDADTFTCFEPGSSRR